MTITLRCRRLKPEYLQSKNPGKTIIDLTSKGPDPWVKFSPFYPHGEIPIPGWPGKFSQSVEGLWQALKVFENEDVDWSKCQIRSMKNIKRGMKGGRGDILGSRQADGSLLGYYEARLQLYLPAYQWVMRNKLANEIAELKRLSEVQDVILLDYELNSVISDLGRPLSHASLVAREIQPGWPDA